MEPKKFSWRFAVGLLILGFFVAAPVRANLPALFVSGFLPLSIYLVYYCLQWNIGVSRGASILCAIGSGFVLAVIAGSLLQTPQSRWNYENDRKVTEIKAKEKAKLCGGNDNCLQINQDTFGCPSKVAFDRIVTFTIQGDKEAATKAIANWCVLLGKGDVVYLDHQEWGSKMKQIHLQGSTQSLWVMSEVISN